jgi:serine/threonine protein phosphatase 1
MRTLVMGDIHGGLRALRKLSKEPITPRYFNFFRDYVDGWSQSPQVLDYLIDLSTTNSCVFIRGNHDELYYIGLQKVLWCTIMEATVTAYAKVNSLTKQRHIKPN